MFVFLILYESEKNKRKFAKAKQTVRNQELYFWENIESVFIITCLPYNDDPQLNDQVNSC